MNGELKDCKTTQVQGSRSGMSVSCLQYMFVPLVVESMDVMTCCIVSLCLTKELRFCVRLIKRDTSVARTMSLLEYCNIAIVCVFNNLCVCLVLVCIDG